MAITPTGMAPSIQEAPVYGDLTASDLRAGLFGLGGALLQAGGPRRVPIGLAGALGQGVQGALGGVAGNRQMERAEKQRDRDEQSHQMVMATMRRILGDQAGQMAPAPGDAGSPRIIPASTASPTAMPSVMPSPGTMPGMMRSMPMPPPAAPRAMPAPSGHPGVRVGQPAPMGLRLPDATRSALLYGSGAPFQGTIGPWGGMGPFAR